MPGSNTRKPKKKKLITINLYYFPAGVRGLLKKAAREALARRTGIKAGEVNFILVSDAEIKKLNNKYRKVNRITDIISFLNSSKPFQGDIYISRQRSMRQAREQGHPWNMELAYLAIHGVLHLFGYTDYTPRERKRMFNLQDRIFEAIGPGVI